MTRQEVAIQELIFQCSRLIRGVYSEPITCVIEAVKIMGFVTLDEDVRTELLQLAKYCGWTDGEEYFSSLKKTEAV